MRQMAVIGLGQFGAHLARKLTKQHCEVLVVDGDDTRVSELRDDVHRAVIADARSLEALRAAISPSVDEVAVCLGDHMGASILCTLHLSELGVKKILATAVNEDHANILKRVGAHEVIFPDLETAARTARRMAHPHMLDYFPFGEEYRIMELVTPKQFVGRTLQSSGLRRIYRLLALAIRSGDTEKYDFMPSSDHPLGEGDVLIVFGREMDLARLMAMD